MIFSNPALHELQKISNRIVVMRSCLAMLRVVAEQLDGNEHARLGPIKVESIAEPEGFDLLWAGKRLRFGFTVGFEGTALPVSRLVVTDIAPTAADSKELLNEPISGDGVIDSWKMPNAGWGATLTTKDEAFTFLLNLLLLAFARTSVA